MKKERKSESHFQKNSCWINILLIITGWCHINHRSDKEKDLLSSVINARTTRTAFRRFVRPSYVSFSLFCFFLLSLSRPKGLFLPQSPLEARKTKFAVCTRVAVLHILTVWKTKSVFFDSNLNSLITILFSSRIKKKCLSCNFVFSTRRGHFLSLYPWDWLKTTFHSCGRSTAPNWVEWERKKRNLLQVFVWKRRKSN